MAVEIGSQIAIGMIKGQFFSQSVENLDYADIAVSGVEGFVTSGGSVLKRLVVNAGNEVVKAGIDVSSQGVDIVGTEGNKKSVESVVTEASIGIAGNATGELTGGIISAKVNNGTDEYLKTTIRAIKRTAKGSSNNVRYVENYVETVKQKEQNKAVANMIGTFMGETTEQIIQE